ncbi:MAG TPA: 3'-5' exonuclease, partial [Gammaproteobacteria bacterium]|nr:3'-5' exonuclease [Gammaproteobacteria bacterium]
KSAGFNPNAVEIDPLTHLPIIQDLVSLTRALVNPADRIAWLALLRAPWCGLSLADLHSLASSNHQQLIWDKLQQPLPLSKNGLQRLQRIFPVLKNSVQSRLRQPLRQWVEDTWVALGGPACVENVQELIHADTFFELLEQLDIHACFADIHQLEEKINRLYATPNTDSDAWLQVMTIHKAKGLEFDTVILPGLHRSSAKDTNPLLLLAERPRKQGGDDLILAPIKSISETDDAIYQYLRKQQQKKAYYETIRLLYVAATRAKHRLYLFANVQQLGRKRPRLFPVIFSPARETRADGDQRGALHCSPLETPSLLSLGQAQEISFFKIKDNELGNPTQHSFLELLWPQLSNQIAMQLPTPLQFKPTQSAEDTILNNSTIKRLSDTWQPPANLFTSHNQDLTATTSRYYFNLTNEQPRIVGIIIHRILQQLSENALPTEVENYINICSRTWQNWLLESGIQQQQLSNCMSIVITAIHNTLHDERGRWIIDQRHSQTQSEYPISTVVNHEITHFIFDRIFIDEKNTR